MSKTKVADLLATQQSLTEWLQDIKHKDVNSLRREDNEKRERLKVLHESIDLPFDQPTQFEATELSQKSASFSHYLAEHGSELCALRVIPKQDGLPKLRMRGKTIADAYKWFLEQKIDPVNYRADFIPHPPDEAWATIFVVNEHGIQGEIIWGGHHQLTQGFHDTKPPHVFRYDFQEWSIEPRNDDALAYLKEITDYLQVGSVNIRKQLGDKLGSTFSHDYLEGYFETTNSSLGTWFIDYSPGLGKLYQNMKVTVGQPKQDGLVRGQVGSRGKAEGIVRLVDPENIEATDFAAGNILVCRVTTPKYIALMQKAAAIVTDQGGILSHAAIVARELKKPCIVATGSATTVLKDGQRVLVDAEQGIVTISSRQ